MIVVMDSTPQRTTHGLSRRTWLTLALGGTAGAISCICGGTAIGAYLIATRANDHQIPLPTSAVGRRDTQFRMASLAILPRSEWGALAPNHDAENEQGFFSDENPNGWRIYPGDLRDIYKTLVVHHAAFYTRDDLTTLLEVQKLHREDRGWADVAYHYLIGKEGTIFEGRDINVRGTHVGGFNTGSVGVCLLGNFMEEIPTRPQMEALTVLGYWLSVRLKLTHVAGHRQFNDDTQCPGDNLADKLENLASTLGLERGTEGYQRDDPA